DTANDHILTLDAGSGGAIDVDGTIGVLGTELGGLIIDTSGDTNLDGEINVGTENINIDTETFDLNAAMNTANGGTITISNGGLAEIDGNITSDGLVTFDNFGRIDLGANITTTGAGANVDIVNSELQLTGDRRIETTDGSITLETVTTDTANDHILTLDAGSGGAIDVDGTIGVLGTELGGLIIDTSGDTNLDGE
ncbi:MAG: hypothetical protein GY849_06115, partial [Deltaproteobacteria bacterium]|nr:hypothetical protein [Deltaproteobacteria bacterium]